VEALAAEPSDPADAPDLVFAGTYVASGSGWVAADARRSDAGVRG
jgi:hypothetical protein